MVAEIEENSRRSKREVSIQCLHVTFLVDFISPCCDRLGFLYLDLIMLAKRRY